jgi:uncharacterized repeat protein (TIGR01451 family)
MKKVRPMYIRLLFFFALSLMPLLSVAQFECEPDITGPIAVCEDQIALAVHPDEGRVIFPDLIDEGSFDLCNPIPEENYRLEFFADNTGEPPSTTFLTLPPEIATHQVILWVGDTEDNWSYCWTNIEVTHFANMVKGQVFNDLDDDCALSPGDEDAAFGGLPIRVWNIDGVSNYYTQTLPDGSYSVVLDDAPIGSLNELRVFFLWEYDLPSSCPTTAITATTPDGIIEENFALDLEDECSNLNVDIGTPFLRRCFTNAYTVRYNNFSTFLVEEATITVTLDDLLELESASIPYTDLGDNTYIFTLDSLAAASNGAFRINVLATCELELGQSQCVEATISPYDCNEPLPIWSGASIVVEGECDDDADMVRFRVRNVGASDQLTPLPFNVVEDVVMYMEDQLDNLMAGGEEIFEFPANGSTWHFAIDQAEGHPGFNNPITFVEGCGGLTTGMINQFALNDSDPNVSIDCQEVVGAYDPNDKQAFPRGYGNENFIEANTPIEYKIRFQNTGTDTAFNVRIDDQISPFLNPATLRAGASSHDYRMEITESNLLRFYFDDIMLPDSNVNEPASHGFVQFWIEQQPDNPNGTIIENNAGIYFDFNEPIITNTVRHTIGEAFITVSTSEENLPEGASLSVFPNPMAKAAWFRLINYQVDNGRFEVYDLQGRNLLIDSFNGSEYQLTRADLTPGMYVYRIVEAGQVLATGKIVVR